MGLRYLGTVTLSGFLDYLALRNVTGFRPSGLHVIIGVIGTWVAIHPTPKYLVWSPLKTTWDIWSCKSSGTPQAMSMQLD